MSKASELDRIRRQLADLTREVVRHAGAPRRRGRRPLELKVAHHDVLRRFGANLRAARAAAGLTQSELAAAAGISKVYLSLLERGGRNPGVTLVVQLAAATGIPAGELLVGLPARVGRRR